MWKSSLRFSRNAETTIKNPKSIGCRGKKEEQIKGKERIIAMEEKVTHQKREKQKKKENVENCHVC